VGVNVARASHAPKTHWPMHQICGPFGPVNAKSTKNQKKRKTLATPGSNAPMGAFVGRIRFVA
jgi:hypothetical protein